MGLGSILETACLYCEEENLEIVEEILKRFIHIDTTGAIHNACNRKVCLPLIRLLVETAPFPANCNIKNRHGSYPIEYLIYNNHGKSMEAINLLLCAGANINLKVRGTPLVFHMFQACWTSEQILSLVSHVKEDTRDTQGRGLIHYFASCKDFTPNHLEVLVKDYNEPINYQDSNGSTFLHILFGENRNHEQFDALVERALTLGANPNLLNNLDERAIPISYKKEVKLYPDLPISDTGPAPSACRVCMERWSVMVSIPCGHVCVCGVCSLELKRLKRMNCLICQAKTMDYFRVFHS